MTNWIFLERIQFYWRYLNRNRYLNLMIISSHRHADVMYLMKKYFWNFVKWFFLNINQMRYLEWIILFFRYSDIDGDVYLLKVSFWKFSLFFEKSTNWVVWNEWSHYSGTRILMGTARWTTTSGSQWWHQSNWRLHHLKTFLY